MALTPTHVRGPRANPEWMARRRAEGAARRQAWEASLPEHAVALPDPDGVGWVCHVMDTGPIKDGSVKSPNHFVPLPDLVDWLFENTEGHRVIAQAGGDAIVPRLYVAIEFKTDADAVLFKLRWL